MKSKTYYDSLPADKKIQVRVPEELQHDFSAMFPRRGDAARCLRDFIIDTVVAYNKKQEK